MMKTLLYTCLISLLATGGMAQSSPKAGKGVLPQPIQVHRSSGGFLYQLTTFSEPYNDLSGAISINNGQVWDDPEYFVPLGFPFEVNGNAFTFLQLGGYGFALVGPTVDPDIITAVFPFETDLIDRGTVSGVSMSPLSYVIEGIPGSRIQKIEFNNAGSFGEYIEFETTEMYINVQIWLYEGTNTIEFRFGDHFIDDPALFYEDGSGALIGLTDFDIVNEIVINSHILTGPASNPVLNTIPFLIEGTPASGTVYRLSLPFPIDVNVNGVDATSVCAPNGSATATADGGVEPYTYAWNNGGTTATIENLDAGTYTVTVTDANSNTATGSVTITNNEPLLANTTATDETVPNAEDGTATASPTGGQPPYTYLWSTGATDAMISGLAPGLYMVTVTDDEGCTTVDSVMVNEAPCPEITAEAEISLPSCAETCDGFIQLAVQGGSPPYTYIWSNGVSSDNTSVCGGDYSVTIIDQNGCMAVFQFTITAPPPLVAHAGSTGETSDDANDGTAWAAPTGGTPPYLYAWTNGSTDSLIVDLEPGVYTVTVTDANLCVDTQSVVVDSFVCQLVAQIIHNACYQHCEGSIEVNLINAVEPISYAWGDGQIDNVIDQLCAGDYTITATDADGCSATATYSVTEPDELLANATSTDETGPGANDGTASASPTGGLSPYTYHWSDGSTEATITDLAPGIYEVIVEDAVGCVDTQTVVVNPFVCSGLVESTVFEISCFESCDGGIVVNVIGGVGPFHFNWSTGDTTNTIFQLCAGIYDLVIFDEGQQCSTSGSFILLDPPVLTITLDELVHITDSTSASISITVAGGTPPYLYSWFSSDAYSSNDEDISDLSPALYGVIVTDSRGCDVLLDSLEIEDRTVSIKDPNTLEVRIYPNPARDQVHIDLEKDGPVHIQMTTVDGKVINTWQDVNRIEVDALSPGMYILKLTSGEKSFVHRMILTK